MEDEVVDVCRGCLRKTNDMILLCRDNEQIKNFLLSHNLISNPKKCPTCGRLAKLNWNLRQFSCRRTYTDNNRHKKKCKLKVSCFKDTFFSRCHIPIPSVLEFITLWLCIPPPRQDYVIRELGISSKTICDWQSFAREVTSDWVVKNGLIIGGVGRTVEISEHRVGKRKCNNEGTAQEWWVIGGVERDDAAKVFVVSIDFRTKETLVDILKQHIFPGTIVVSDIWKSYGIKRREGFTYLSANLAVNIVDSDSGTQTQSVQRMFREIRTRVTRYFRIKSDYKGYLSEYLFKKAFPDHRERVHEFFMATAALYPPNG